MTVPQFASQHGLEQDRRDFKATHPVLYQYIADREAAKALDSAGDLVSGVSHEAANTVWAASARHDNRARTARGD